jgi:hypothetical protein
MDTEAERADEEPGLRLLHNSDAEVIARDDGVVVCICMGHDLDLALHGLAAFATVLGVVITLIVVAGAPRLLLSVSITWFVGAATMVGFARARRRRHGRFEIDGARGELRHLFRGAVVRIAPLTEVVRAVSVRDPTDLDGEERPRSMRDVPRRWLVLELRDGARLRLARGLPWELARIEKALREEGIATGQG